jgi:hypothetical protein
VEKYAVCVGIANYPGSNDLQNPDEDANDWHSFLNSKSYTVTKRINSAAKKSTVRNDVQTMADNADMNDIIVFTFSGHGNVISGNYGYMILYDFSYKDDDLYDDLKNTKAARCFIFLDCCCSGCFLDEFSGKSKFLVVTACDSDGLCFDLHYVSDDGPPYYPSVAENGAWTYFFLKIRLQANPNSALEWVFNQAINSFENWYHGSHYAYDGSWQEENWEWNLPNEPANGPQEGNPQLGDGDGVSNNFTL